MCALKKVWPIALLLACVYSSSLSAQSKDGSQVQVFTIHNDSIITRAGVFIDDVSIKYDLESSKDSLRGSVAAFAANADAVAHVVSASGDSPIARLQLHIPSEAYFMTTLIEEVLAHP